MVQPSPLRPRGTAEHLTSTLGSPVLVAAIEALPGGSFRARTQTWASYWQPLEWLRDEGIRDALDALRSAWEAYITSGFDPHLAQPYVHRYFALLAEVRMAESRNQNTSIWRRALQRVAAFECFPIRGMFPLPGDHAAGTTTLRNPCYLMARLRWPDEQDDVKYLPLITVDDREGPWFFHYRQFPLTDNPSQSLLALLPNDEHRRAAGLRVTAALGHSLNATTDPYAESRARRLWQHVLKPLQEPQSARSAVRESLELLDVGSSAGALAQAIVRRFTNWSVGQGHMANVRLWFVDSSGRDPSPRFYSRSLARFVRGAQFLSSDYRAWLAGSRRHLPTSFGMRVGIVSKVFDLFSKMSIDMVSTDVLHIDAGRNRVVRRSEHLPQNCLRPGGLGPGALMMARHRVSAERGHVYPQLSLTDFFETLVRSVSEGEPASLDDDGPFLPVRRFEPQSLVSIEGESVVGALMDDCDYLVVEDQDTQADDLIRHFRQFSLSDLGALDMTKSMGLTNNYSYLVWRKAGRLPPVNGIRVW